MMELGLVSIMLCMMSVAQACNNYMTSYTYYNSATNRQETVVTYSTVNLCNG